MATWSGFVSVDFGIGVFGRRNGGWRASISLRTAPLEKALWAPPCSRTQVRRGGRGSRSLSTRCTGRLAEAWDDPSVGNLDDSCDGAPLESVIGLFKAEVINQQGSWRNLEGVEVNTLDRVPWHEAPPLATFGPVSPAEFEERYHLNQQSLAAVVGLN